MRVDGLQRARKPDLQRGPADVLLSGDADRPGRRRADRVREVVRLLLVQHGPDNGEIQLGQQVAGLAERGLVRRHELHRHVAGRHHDQRLGQIQEVSQRSLDDVALAGVEEAMAIATVSGGLQVGRPDDDHAHAVCAQAARNRDGSHAAPHKGRRRRHTLIMVAGAPNAEGPSTPRCTVA